MPPGGGQSQGGEADNSLAAIWITIGIFVLMGFIWYFFSTYIISFVLTIRSYEAAFINLFLPSSIAKPLNQMQTFIQDAKARGYTGVTFTDLINASNVVGDYLRYPIIALFLGLTLLLYLGNATARYKKTYNMRQLLSAEKESWPGVTPVSKLDLVHEDINKGPWAMAPSPMDFAKKHNLLIIEKVLPSDAILKSKVIQTATINRDDARKLFAMQLGPFWQGYEALPIHARALFAAFAGRIAGDRDGPTKLLHQIAYSSAGKLNFAGTDELYAKHRDNKVVQKLTQRHAYVLTVMASMLAMAREDGVLPSADFLWLKPIDRRLWFMLNSTGRQTPFSDVGGPYAHWLAEKELGRKLNVPMIEEAVNGLSDAMKEFIYKPEDPEDEEQAIG